VVPVAVAMVVAQQQALLARRILAVAVAVLVTALVTMLAQQAAPASSS